MAASTSTMVAVLRSNGAAERLVTANKAINRSFMVARVVPNALKVGPRKVNSIQA